MGGWGADRYRNWSQAIKITNDKLFFVLGKAGERVAGMYNFVFHRFIDEHCSFSDENVVNLHEIAPSNMLSFFEDAQKRSRSSRTQF